MPSLPPRGVKSVAYEVRVLRKDFEAKMLQLNQRIASISDSVKVSSHVSPLWACKSGATMWLGGKSVLS